MHAYLSYTLGYNLILLYSVAQMVPESMFRLAPDIPRVSLCFGKGTTSVDGGAWK